jgi:hypothetical protein
VRWGDESRHVRAETNVVVIGCGDPGIIAGIGSRKRVAVTM